MKLLFVVTGFGYGDTIRADSIINEILKQDKKTQIMVMGYDHSFNYFKNKFLTLKIAGYDFPDQAMEFKTHRFLIKNFYLPASWLWSLKKYRKTIKKFNPDLIISDFELFANILARNLKKRCVSIFAYDPYAYKKFPKKNNILNIQARFIERIYENSDKVVIPSFKGGEDKDNLHYVNPIVRDYKFEDKKKIMKKLKLKKEPIVVMLGGSKFGIDLGKEIIKLYDSFDEEFIIFGGLEPILGYHFPLFQENFLEYLKVSKAVITLAGNLTLSEAIAFKKPMLIFPIRSHIEQLLNAYKLRDLAIVKYNTKRIDKAVEMLLKKKEILSKKLGKLSIKTNGAQQTANLIKRWS